MKITAIKMDLPVTLFATLKAPPETLPPNVGAVWIENGTAGKLQEAA